MRIGTIYSEGPRGMESRCPMCGKTFAHGSAWAYKDGNTYYCSWGCMRAMRQEVEMKARTKITDEIRRRVMELHAQGLSHEAVAQQVGIAMTTVRRIVMKCKEPEEKKPEAAPEVKAGIPEVKAEEAAEEKAAEDAGEDWAISTRPDEDMERRHSLREFFPEDDEYEDRDRMLEKALDILGTIVRAVCDD